MKKYKKMIAMLLSMTMLYSMHGCASNTSYVDEEKESTMVLTTKEQLTMKIEYEEKTTTEPTTTEKAFVEKNEIIYTKSNVNLRSAAGTDSDVLDVIDKYTTLQLIKTNDSWDYVSYNGMEGFVSSKYTDILGDTYVEVDISDQLLYLYVDKNLVREIDVTTGMENKWDTRCGCNPIYTKERNKGLNGEGYNNLHVNYWMPFDGGIGLHDASWRSDDSFGGDTYKTNGSHGCVSMKNSDAKEVYDNVSVGTKVLVHK